MQCEVHQLTGKREHPTQGGWQSPTHKYNIQGNGLIVGGIGSHTGMRSCSKFEDEAKKVAFMKKCFLLHGLEGEKVYFNDDLTQKQVEH